METKTIGGRIAEARKKMNISQAQLAKRLFISAQAVGKWERGESMPDIIMLNRLAEILGVDLNYFSENFQPAEDEINDTTGSSKGVEEKESGGREFNTNFSGRRLQEVDLAGVTAHKRKFKASALNGAADFQARILPAVRLRSVMCGRLISMEQILPTVFCLQWILQMQILIRAYSCVQSSTR